MIGPEDRRFVRETRWEDLIRFHHGWGIGIRNAFGLWQGNTPFLESSGARRED
jgi:hypothetical protein